MLNLLKYNEAIKDIGPLSPLTNQPPFTEVGIMTTHQLSQDQQKCKHNGCYNIAKTKGYCKTHYEAFRRRGKICKIEGCKEAWYIGDYCRSHWRKWREFATPVIRNKFDTNRITVVGDVCKSELYNGKNEAIGEALVDADDKYKVEGYKWALIVSKTSQYVMRSHKYKIRQLHNIIFGDVPNGFEVDHEDRDTLNNRKSNLRLATRSLNNANSKMRKTNTSGFKGVSWCKQKGKYIGQIAMNNKHFYLGCSDDPIELAIKYNEAALEHFGEFARLNEI